MAVQCTQCGATLIGAVNRCWQCGNPLSPAALVDDETTVAAAVQDEAGVEVEDHVDAPEDHAQVAGGAGVAGVAAGSDEQRAVSAEMPEPDKPPIRSDTDEAAETDPQEPSPAERQQPGSPFAQPEIGQLKSAAAPAHYQKNIANSVGAVLAVLLGVLALIEAPYVPIGAVFTALIGLACGVWGIKSNRRTSSTLGMFLCCVALAWGIFNATVELYTHYTGNDPFAPNTAIESPAEEDEMIDPFDDPSF